MGPAVQALLYNYTAFICTARTIFFALLFSWPCQRVSWKLYCKWRDTLGISSLTKGYKIHKTLYYFNYKCKTARDIFSLFNAQRELAAIKVNQFCTVGTPGLRRNYRPGLKNSLGWIAHKNLLLLLRGTKCVTDTCAPHSQISRWNIFSPEKCDIFELL